MFLIWGVFPFINVLDAEILFNIPGRRGQEIDVIVFLVILATYKLYRVSRGKSGLSETGDNGKKILDGDALVVSFVLASICWYVYGFFS